MKIHSIEEMNQLGESLALNLKPGMLVLLNGDLGVGKTTLTKAIGKKLGISRAIKSPTYTIVKEYPTHFGSLIHIDAYRLNEGGADSIDFESYLKDNHLVLVEWGQYLVDYLPISYMMITIERGQLEEERQVSFDVIGENQAYHQLIEEVEGLVNE